MPRARPLTLPQGVSVTPNLQVVVHPDRLGLTDLEPSRDVVVFGLKIALSRDMALKTVRND